ncbi:unnamed protein product [Brassica napus]|uniref:(rape) hypothetical protein n=1 Tax=Brassica napus TaxID=3708 RepID=A0A816XA17_BRANA|nr:unnamed protein product [Brassica napus]
MDNRCCRICLISASAPPPPFRSNLNSPLTSVEAHHAVTLRLNTIAEPTKPYSSILLLKPAGNYKSITTNRRSEEIEVHGFRFETLRFNTNE